MTIEKMEKAKELNHKIKYLEEQLLKIEKVSKDTNLRINGNNSMFDLSIKLKDTILLLCKANFQNELDKTKSEFEEL